MKLFSLRNKNKGKLTLQDLFSNEVMQQSLENLNWAHGESGKKAFEWVKISAIEKESQVLSIILASIKKPLQFGEYLYRPYGNRIERTGPPIKIETKKNPLVSLSSPFRIRIKKKVQPKGVVTVN